MSQNKSNDNARLSDLPLVTVVVNSAVPRRQSLWKTRRKCSLELALEQRFSNGGSLWLKENG